MKPFLPFPDPTPKDRLPCGWLLLVIFLAALAALVLWRAATKIPTPQADEDYFQEEDKGTSQTTEAKPQALPDHLVKLIQDGLDARENEKPKCPY